jgi:O-antigen/teichoic acid export membrane protein
VDISWVAAINALAQGIGVLAMPLLTRLYGPSDFAQLNIFTNCVAFATVLLSLRYEYMVQLTNDHRDARAVLFAVAALGVVGCVVSIPVIWWFRLPLAEAAGNAQLASSLVFVPVTAALICTSLALQHVTQRDQQFKTSSVSDIVSRLCYVGAALVGRLVSPTAAGLIATGGAGAIGKIAWLGARGRRQSVEGGSGIEWSRVREVLGRYRRLSTSLAFSGLMLTLTGLIPSILISHAYGSQTLGQFALVVSTNFLPSSLLGAAIGQVYYQRAASRWSEGNDFIDLWRITVRKLLAIGLPVYGAMALLSPWLYPLVFGRAWAEAGIFASILSVAAFFAFLSGPLDRSCLIVSAWRYIPAWHVARTVTTALVAGVAVLAHLSPRTFLILLSLQMTLMYAIDLFAERHFAAMKPAAK